MTTIVDLMHALEELPELVANLRETSARMRVIADQGRDPDELLTVEEAAKFLRMSTQAIRQAAYRGSIPSVRIGRRLRFKRGALAKVQR